MRLRRGAPIATLVVLLGGLLVPAPLRAQDSTGVAVPAPAAPDSAVAAPDSAVAAPDSSARRPSPTNAFLRSFLIPGWGQAKLDRKLTAGILLAWEGVTFGMSLKTRHELAYLRRTGSGRAEDKRREHEDWLVLLGFNHLFAGLEAYVSAHLSDFPRDLKLRATPGGVGAMVSLPIRVR